MHFSMLACLVTIVGLVSVACAVPTISARATNPRLELSFLNQKDPVASLGKRSHTRVEIPTKFKDFLESTTIRAAVGHTTSTNPIDWIVTAMDDTYKAHIDQLVPVSAQFIGGKKCTFNYQCMAIVVDGSHGMISRKTDVVTQVGNLAIVSFDHFTTAPTLQQTPSKSMDALAVHWLLTSAEVEVHGAKEKVHKALGFNGDPKIVYVDPVPDSSMDTLSFSFYGGTKCFPGSPCKVLIEHKSEPEPLGTFEAKIVHVLKDMRERVLYKTKLSPSDIGWTR